MVAALVKTLASAVAPGGQVLLAHGRNRGAEPTFLAEARRQGLRCLEVPSSELDSVFQCADVSVWRLLPKQQASRTVAGSGNSSSGTASVGSSSRITSRTSLKEQQESSSGRRAAVKQEQQSSSRDSRKNRREADHLMHSQVLCRGATPWHPMLQ